MIDKEFYSLVYTDDFVGSGSSKVIEITIKRSLLGHGIFHTHSEKCEINIRGEIIFLCDCTDVQNDTFSIGGNLVSLYGVWLYHDLSFLQSGTTNKRKSVRTVNVQSVRKTICTTEKNVSYAILNVDHESPWWARDMWDLDVPGISYFPQWTNQDTLSSRGIMRYNDYMQRVIYF